MARQKFIRVAAISLVVAFVSLAAPITVLAADNENSLTFFRVAERESYNESPSKYERGIVSSRVALWGLWTAASGNTGIAEPIERQPAYVIPENAIDSIVIKKIGTSQDLFYLATFKLNAAEAEKLRVFMDENSGDRFHVRFGKRKIAVALFTAPIEVTSPLTIVVDASLNSLNEIFAPFKNKLVFE